MGRTRTTFWGLGLSLGFRVIVVLASPENATDISNTDFLSAWGCGVAATQGRHAISVDMRLPKTSRGFIRSLTPWTPNLPSPELTNCMKTHDDPRKPCPLGMACSTDACDMELRPQSACAGLQCITWPTPF